MPVFLRVVFQDRHVGAGSEQEASLFPDLCESLGSDYFGNPFLRVTDMGNKVSQKRRTVHKFTFC
jgi:hypothetical protein